MQYSLYRGALADLPASGKRLVCCLNQYSYCLAEEDEPFKQALRGADVLLPDGIGMVVAARWLDGVRIKKIAGADLHRFLLQHLDGVNGRCFYLGSSETVLLKIRERLAVEFPGVQAGFYAPPFRAEFSPAENAQMIAAANAFRPDVLFISMTAPKQEKWAYAHKAQLNAGMICCTGAVFDFYAGTVARPHPRLVAAGLEWLGRLAREPRRLWKRYLYYGPVFVFLLAKEKMRRRQKAKHPPG